MYRIIDLDNCISDDGHRIHLIDRELPFASRYHAYHMACVDDPLGNADLLETNERLVILTGRPVRYHNLTTDWLRLHGIAYDHMIMRNLGDYRPSHELKVQQVGWLVGLYGIDFDQITSAYDDNHDVVQAYRAIGLLAEQRAINDRATQ